MNLEEIKERVRKAGFHVPAKVQKEYLQDNGYGRICWRDHSIKIEPGMVIYHAPKATRTGNRWIYITLSNPADIMRYVEL